MQKLIFTNGAGKQIDLTAGNFGITNWEGLSNTALNIQTQQVPFEDGGVFLDALMEQREIAVTVAIYDGNNLELRYQKKRELISALNPKLGEGTLIYTNDYLLRQIKAVPQIPLFENKNSNDAGTLKASVAFSCPSPYWEDIDDTVITFNITQQPLIKNNGDIPVNVKMTFNANDVLYPTITNLRNSNMISYNGNLNKNLFIDTNTGHKKAETYDVSFLQQMGSYEYNAIIYSRKHNAYVLIGSENGTGFNYTIIQKSKSLYNWEMCIDEQKAGFLSDIVYSEEKDLFVAVGGNEPNSFIYTSSNLKDWSIQTITNGQVLKIVKYYASLGLFIAISRFKILKSENGVDWSVAYQDETAEFNSITYNGSEYIINSTGGSVSTTDFVNFSTVYSIAKSLVYSTKYNCYYDVYEGVRKTVDFVTYEDCVTPITTWLDTCFLYADENRLLLINGNKIYECLDGINFNLLTQTEAEILKINYSNFQGLYYLLGNQSLLKTSIDFSNYDLISFIPEGGSNINALAYSEKDNIYIANIESGVCFINKGDTGWKYRNENIGQKVEYYKGNINKFITSTHYSTNGDDWILNSENVGELRAYREADQILITITYNNGFKCKITENGLNWQTYNTTGLSGFGWDDINKLVCLDNQNFIIIGKSGKVAKSTNGIDWTVIKNDSADGNFYDITYNSMEKLYYVLGAKSYITDLINWTYREDFKFKCLQYSNIDNKFYAIKNDPWTEEKKVYSGVDINDLSLLIENEAIMNASDIKPIQECNSVFVFGAMGLIINAVKLNYTNAIDKISENSNMNFTLEIGDNTLRLNKESGDFVCVLSFKQKYIGV